MQTLESPTVILTEEAQQAQDVLNEITQLVVEYEHALADNSKSVNDVNTIRQKMVEMVHYATRQSDVKQTYPKPPRSYNDNEDVVIELTNGANIIGITGRFSPSDDSIDAFTWIRYGEIRDGELINRFPLSADQLCDLDAFLIVLRDEGVFTLPR